MVTAGEITMKVMEKTSFSHTSKMHPVIKFYPVLYGL